MRLVGDPIIGVIRGSATNQDGRSATITAPSGLCSHRSLGLPAYLLGRTGAEKIFLRLLPKIPHVMFLGRAQQDVIAAAWRNAGVAAAEDLAFVEVGHAATTT